MQQETSHKSNIGARETPQTLRTALLRLWGHLIPDHQAAEHPSSTKGPVGRGAHPVRTGCHGHTHRGGSSLPSGTRGMGCKHAWSQQERAALSMSQFSESSPALVRSPQKVWAESAPPPGLFRDAHLSPESQLQTEGSQGAPAGTPPPHTAPHHLTPLVQSPGGTWRVCAHPRRRRNRRPHVQSPWRRRPPTARKNPRSSPEWGSGWKAASRPLGPPTPKCCLAFRWRPGLEKQGRHPGKESLNIPTGGRRKGNGG